MSINVYAFTCLIVHSTRQSDMFSLSSSLVRRFPDKLLNHWSCGGGGWPDMNTKEWYEGDPNLHPVNHFTIGLPRYENCFYMQVCIITKYLACYKSNHFLWCLSYLNSKFLISVFTVFVFESSSSNWSQRFLVMWCLQTHVTAVFSLLS